MKDRFSSDPKGYATFRPGYPDALLAYILEHTPGRGQAWDCGTGNGQFAALLAPHFAQVQATDISAAQLAQATPLPNVRYSQQPAEHTDFPAQGFDLVTVAQAIHWFDFDRFYAEVRRVAAPQAMIAVVGYPLCSVSPQVDAVLHHFYHEAIHAYWDAERRHLDAEYRTIPFPFQEQPCPRFNSTHQWDLDRMLGYLRTWSAVKNYLHAQGTDPVTLIEPHLRKAWGPAETQQVTIPIILRLGKIT